MKSGHARWYGQAVILALCPGSEYVWVAYRQLHKVSQEQLRLITISERVADDVIRQEPRIIGVGENSAVYFSRSTITVSRRVHSGKSGRESRTTGTTRKAQFETCSTRKHCATSQSR